MFSPKIFETNSSLVNFQCSVLSIPSEQVSNNILLFGERYIKKAVLTIKYHRRPLLFIFYSTFLWGMLTCEKYKVSLNTIPDLTEHRGSCEDMWLAERLLRGRGG